MRGSRRPSGTAPEERRSRKSKGGELGPETVDSLGAKGAWTTGSTLTTKAITVGLGLCLVAGPVALVVSLLTPEAVAVGVVDSRWDSRPATAAGERAQEVVVAWLEATAKDSARASSLLGETTSVFPDAGLATRSPAVLQTVELPAGVWSVTVGVDVLEPVAVAEGAAEGEEASQEWRRRYFVVPVQVTLLEQGPGVEVLSAPMPVAAPPETDYTSTDYITTVQKGAPLAVTIADFLGALVAGQGDLTRFTAPGAPIVAIVPAPYASVNVLEVRASDNEAGVTEPDEGQEASVLVTVELVRPDGMKVPTQYALNLVTRAARWEIAAIAPSPVVTTDKRRPADVATAPVTTSGVKTPEEQGGPAAPADQTN